MTFSEWAMIRGLGGTWSPFGLSFRLHPHLLEQPEDIPFFSVHKENFMVYCTGCSAVCWRLEMGICGQCKDCHGSILRNIFHSEALHRDWKDKGDGNM
eukprot:7510794-Heterocapsa_arctica.AAC.1